MPDRNIVTWIGVISAFIPNGRFEYGAELFRAMGIAALIDVYAKCGHANSASQHFNELPWRNLVSWNAMISGYNYNGNAQESLELFVDMQRSENIRPDSFTIVAVLSSCSSLASSRGGKEIHGCV
ncbi:hypothetical protein MRB53_002030 [Persea americana]|uniref:Uncharacterized protein n=1 Tax=Persea americana TaxID=3435 RepID=A0ACC2MVQ0_PERAE|nr:hypothetical protein MRB53_002030 [Persea americana]